MEAQPGIFSIASRSDYSNKRVELFPLSCEVWMVQLAHIAVKECTRCKASNWAHPTLLNPVPAPWSPRAAAARASWGPLHMRNSWPRDAGGTISTACSRAGGCHRQPLLFLSVTRLQGWSLSHLEISGTGLLSHFIYKHWLSIIFLIFYSPCQNHFLAYWLQPSGLS